MPLAEKGARGKAAAVNRPSTQKHGARERSASGWSVMNARSSVHNRKTMLVCNQGHCQT